jgi:hypothetical protein
MNRRLPLPIALAGLLALVLLGLLVWLGTTPVDVPAARPTAVTGARAEREAPPPGETDEPHAVEAPTAITAVASAPGPERTRLVGRITDTADAPIPGARVLVTIAASAAVRTRDLTAWTDPEGRYVIADARGEITRVVFSAEGFATRTLTRPTLDGAPVARLDATLESEADLHGIVRGPEGPVSGAVLGLWLPGGRAVTTVAQSDDGGRFALAFPDGGGPYTLKARHPTQGEASLTIDLPGEYVVELPGGGYVEGRVVDASRDPVQVFAVSAEPRARRMMARPMAQSFDAGDGAFRLGPLAAGTYALRAAAEGFQPGEPVEVEIEPGQVRSGVVLVMKASGTLVGRVTDAATRRPIEGALIVPAEWSNGDLAESVGALTDADGRYRLRALPGKRSSLTVSADGYRALLGGGVLVAPGQSVTRDFALTPQAAGQASATELTGIGAVLAPQADGVAISQIVEGGPAASRLSAGDVIVAVDGKATAGLPLGDVANAIRGELGTEVTLLVRREGAGEPERVVVRRDRVSMPDRRPRGRTPHGDPHGGPHGDPHVR